MRRFSNFIVCSILFFGITSGIKAQNCDLRISGQIIDEGSREGLPFATLFVEELKDGTVADFKGEFELESLCPGEYHLRIDHVGCASMRIFINVQKDTLITIELQHHAALIDEVIIHGKSSGSSTQSNQTIMEDELAKGGNTNLSAILEQLSGVSSLKNGSGIAKPIIHGLSGNRITLLNNGIAQAGQQWGNDHAPEIDPFVAEHLAVIKGAAALAYGGNSLGSVVLIEPGKIHKEPHLHGHLQYLFDSNGRGQTVNTKFERSEKAFSWRFTGTGKIFGDRNASDYYLTNTGLHEGNFAVQLDKGFNLSNHSSLYYSYFNTEIGILRGSHISNLTDLEEAIGRDIPLFTKESFSYAIDAPRQKVNHHLLKYEHELFLSNDAVFKFVSGTQFNNRKEFDIRRAGRTALPSLSIFQWDQFLESYYQRSFRSNGTWKSGIQFNLRDNTNNPETGVLPLIPDFRRFQYSLYSIVNNSTEKWGYEFGFRTDFQNMEVLSISRTLPREIIRTKHQFLWLSGSAGAFAQLGKGLKTTWNVGFTNRPPGVHELYSIGLHQGVSGIEEGDPTLVSERSVKIVGSLQYQHEDKLYLELLAFHQEVKDFIYLQAQPEFRLTVQGAFPVFQYKQANSYLSGVDMLCSYEPIQELKWVGKFAYVRGWNREEALPLVNIPPASINNSLQWYLKTQGAFKDPAIMLKGRYVFSQTNYVTGQDLLAPPGAYFLGDLELETHLDLGSYRLKIIARCENLFNRQYRNYLNRLRYFADDQGRNFVVGLLLKY